MELLLVAILGSVAGWFAHSPSDPVACVPNPLASVECQIPSLPKDDTFGETTYKLIEVVGQYKKCRAACGVK